VRRSTPAASARVAAPFTNSPAALRTEIARAGKNPRVVLEATYGWHWAADVLQAAGAEVHLAHPLGVKAFTYRRVKDDFRDAADLADLLRMERLRGRRVRARSSRLPRRARGPGWRHGQGVRRSRVDWRNSPGTGIPIRS
jgi:transposase